MKRPTLALLFIIFALYFVAALSGCSTKTIMKECEKINDSHLFICKPQWEVFR